jgi:hypothetical protein
MRRFIAAVFLFLLSAIFTIGALAYCGHSFSFRQQTFTGTALCSDPKTTDLAPKRITGLLNGALSQTMSTLFQRFRQRVGVLPTILDAQQVAIQGSIRLTGKTPIGINGTNEIV